MIARVNVSEEKIEYMSTDAFFSLHMRRVLGEDHFKYPEAKEWAKYGRPYSRYQIDKELFVKVPEENDEEVWSLVARIGWQE